MKYVDFADVFFLNLAIMLFENTGINEYIIKLTKGYTLCYSLIYNLGLVKLEIQKIYIKTQIKIGFIQPLKYFVDVSIFFKKKL